MGWKSTNSRSSFLGKSRKVEGVNMIPEHEGYLLYNHQTSSLSKLDQEMIKYVPPGGNWRDIPESIPSKRLEQIRRTGGRTTYYGRLRWDAPAYTISTYFNRPGNGTYIHPDQNRLISFREAARLQGFPDQYRFWGPKSSLLKQIGNAVPPLLAFAIASALPGETVADIFAGAGGLSLGFSLAGYTPVAALEIEKHAARTYSENHPEAQVILGDATKEEHREQFIQTILDSVGKKGLDVLVGGPPCQGFSTAGWRKANDPRNFLWVAYLKVVDALKPRWLLMENVPGFLSTKVTDDETGKDTATLVIEVLIKELQSRGYRPTYFILSAEKYGVPQKRKRLFILAFRNDQDALQRYASSHLPPRPLTAKSITVWQAIGNLPSLGINDGHEVLVLDQLPYQSAYQAWVQGKLTLQEFFAEEQQMDIIQRIL